MLAPTVLASVRAELPDPQQSMHVLRATFCEVWWMSEYHVRNRSTPTNVQAWITGIARARCAERRRTLDLSHDPSWAAACVLTGALDTYDQWTQLQLATMLDGPDTVQTPESAAGCGARRRVVTGAEV